MTTTGALELLAERPGGLTVAEARRPHRPPRLSMVVVLLAFVALAVGVLVVARRSPEPPVGDVPQVPNRYLPTVSDDLVVAGIGRYGWLEPAPTRVYARLVGGRPQQLLAVLRTPLERGGTAGAAIASPTAWFELEGRPANYSPADSYGWGLQVVEIRLDGDQKLVVVGFAVTREELQAAAASADVDGDGLPLLGDPLGLPLQAQGMHQSDGEGLHLGHRKRTEPTESSDGEPARPSASSFAFIIDSPQATRYEPLISLWVDPAASTVVDVAGTAGVLRVGDGGALVTWAAPTGERLNVSGSMATEELVAVARSVAPVSDEELVEALAGAKRYSLGTSPEAMRGSVPSTTWRDPGG